MTNPTSPAIQHSLVRLAKARAALERLESSASLDERASAWSDLLLAGNAVYSKLEQGSKVSGKAAAWFGRAERVRKLDPLLAYMHHARNSEEHGIEDITSRVKAGDASFTFREPFDPAKLEGLQLRIDTDAMGRVRVSSSDEDVITTKEYSKPSLVLVRVTDPRFNDYFDPPYTHLGSALLDQSPEAVGRLFVEHLNKLIEEAQGAGI